ncbi:DUF4865 family protein [Anaerostipes sp.]|uniref:DUF4865 family protein n=1 Tax=Anaerostipes sp. TaxID=1872530 RepID=UPI0025C55B1A|nr:DUF4865 family protein [Anaerostipes sp.]MBS7009238.1 DUF4865 family protein [Anaerostipes sp.]
MTVMQYKISLPSDYDMEKIRQRIKENGFKTDGFPDLIFKAYLVSQKGRCGSFCNEYAPLYLWNDAEGMNKFIFRGFYDNILDSFGWQKIHTGIPFHFELGKNFSQSACVLEYKKAIPETEKMTELSYSLNLSGSTGKMLIYDPEKWESTEYYFFEAPPEMVSGAKLYQVLHISRQNGK